VDVFPNKTYVNNTKNKVNVTQIIMDQPASGIQINVGLKAHFNAHIYRVMKYVSK
jgi:hypothetical protein